MLNRVRRCVFASLGLCLTLAPGTSVAAAMCTEPVHFGLTTALTGNVALLGVQARNGTEFATEEINRNGGIAGQQVVLTTEDTGASSTDALNAMNRIIERKPLVIFGSMISPHVFTQTEAVTKSETPFLVGATNGKITAQGSRCCFAPTCTMVNSQISCPVMW